MKNLLSYLQKFSKEFNHAFSIEKRDDELSDDEDVKLLTKLANGITNRKMSAPAILFLETLRPMSYLGSQAMAFFKPFCTMIFRKTEYEEILKVLEKRESVTKLIQLLEKIVTNGQ